VAPQDLLHLSASEISMRTAATSVVMWWKVQSMVFNTSMSWFSLKLCTKIQFNTNNSLQCLSPKRSAKWWGQETNDLRFKSMQGQEIQFVSKMSRLALKNIQPPIQWVLWVLFLEFVGFGHVTWIESVHHHALIQDK